MSIEMDQPAVPPEDAADVPTQPQLVARHVGMLYEAMRPFLELVAQQGAYTRTAESADFMAGNPQELAMPPFVAALTRWSVPQDKDWYAYKMMHRPAQTAAAAGLSRRLNLEFAPDDIFLTRGAFGGLATALHTVVDGGDEVIFISPPWFFYEAMILAARATPVRVKADPATFDLDLAAIAEAITPRTRAVIVNTPNNPTGRIYPPQTLQRLATVLSTASQRNGRPIYMISDEAYSRILFDGRSFDTPGRYYPYTFLVHTYSKSALAPGQRLGYVALPPSMPDREGMRGALMLVAMTSGTGLPDAVMQYALPEIEPLLIDLDHLQRKRDRMVRALREQGYEMHLPESTFYLLPKSPLADDVAFTQSLARRDVFVLPGSTVEMPGYFRISLTATDEMIERALPQFAAAIQEAAQAA